MPSLPSEGSAVALRTPRPVRRHVRKAPSHLHVLPSDRGVAAGAEERLIERSAELDLLRDAVAQAARGDGRVIVLEAAAGLGKTALLDRAAQMALDAGFVVRRAAPGPLERHFPYGVVRALLEAPLREASDHERERLLDGAAAAAGALLLDGAAPVGSTTMMTAHGVHWLCSAMTDEQPLALVVDDAQWGDRCSLEVLSYLARRVVDLPLLLVVATRADDPDAPSDLLTILGGARSGVVLHPQPLTLPGAVTLIRRVAPGAPVPVCRDCHRAVDGNPWLLGELAQQIAAHGPQVFAGPDPAALTLTTIARDVVRRRVASLKPSDRAVVAALAVVGDGAAPHVLAAVAGVPVGDLGAARDALLAAGLLDAQGERFAHGLIAAAIHDDLARTERERLHREAAGALADAGAPADVVAGHLLECGPRADAQVSALLVGASDDAAQRGAPHTAAAYLERALGERAAGDDRGRMLARLATVAFDAGLPDSKQRLREALRDARDRDSRLDVLTRLAALNVVDTSDAELSQLLDDELATIAENDPDMRLAVQTAALDALLIQPERHLERAELTAAITPGDASDPLLRRVVSAHRAWLANEVAGHDAETCAQLALEGLEGDVLLRESSRRVAFHLCARVLVMTDRAEDAARAVAALRDEADTRGSLRLRAIAEWIASELAMRTGRVADSENHARLALDLVDENLNLYTGGAIEMLICALAERGAFAEAHELLREHDLDGPLGETLWEIGIRHARARLALAEGDFELAHAEALAAGALREAQGRPNPTWTPWRSTAALALAHLGRRDEAAVLADAELAMAERFGAPLPIVGALHARAVAESEDAARIALCERALAVAENAPPSLEAVRVRVELGSTQARMGDRVGAREALRPALAEADATGAVLVAARARRELVATGLRPRNAAIDGIAALTPRQRQVCELAANGKTNREIAHELFLSVKTVETHLAAGYRKLDVNNRADLATQLAG